MKKGRYFRDELRKTFIIYAIVPSVVFTLVCGVIFLAAFLNARLGSNAGYNLYVSEKLDNLLEVFDGELQRLAVQMEAQEVYENPAVCVQIFEDFYQVSNELGYKANLFIADDSGSPLLSSTGTWPQYLEAQADGSWGIYNSIAMQEGGTAVRLVNSWNQQNTVLIMGLSVQRGEETEYLIISVDDTELSPLLDRTDTQLIVADRFGWVYFGNNYQFIDGSNRVVPELEKAGRYLSYERKLYIVGANSVRDGQFMVYSISDIQTLIASLGISGALLITTFAVTALWLIISARRVTERKTKDFYRILDVMEGARDGNLDELISIESDNEFKTIADAYNEMIVSLKQQMENNRRMSELVSSSQIRQLESQFNPHFLFNTLENIRYMCRIEPHTADKMIFSLSGLLRYSLDASREEVTLSDDIENLECYLAILKYRFNQRLSYEIMTEPDTMNCFIPKLVLQPLIENSVKYGFGDKEELKVEIKAYIHDGTLVLICRDDGVGMTPQCLSEMISLLEQEESNSKHSGLYNIHRRIQILYGRPYGVEIRSTAGYGTTLVVKLPAREEM